MKNWKIENTETNEIGKLYAEQYSYDLRVLLYEIEIGEKIWFLKTKAHTELDWHPEIIDY